MFRNLAGKCSFALFILVLTAAIGCGGISGNRLSSSPNPTPTPVASPTPTPSPTPFPSPTPITTPTPLPTPTPSTTPTPVPTPTPAATSTVVFVGSSLSGGVSAFKLNSDGTLTPVPGDGITGNFSASAIAQSGSSLVAAQQGAEVTVNLYSISAQTGALALQTTVQIPAQPLDNFGTLSAAMNDEFAYIGTANGIYAFSIANGNLTPVPGSPFRTLEANPAANLLQGNSQARMAFSPSGKFLYQNFHQQGVINVYSIHPQTGKLALSSQTAAHGLGTGIAMDPSGRFLIGVFSDDTGEHLAVYSVNSATGALTRVPGSYPVGSTTRPTDILITSF